MYIDTLFDENIGPIDKVNIMFPFTDSGSPKPVVFVGENGSGASIGSDPMDEWASQD